MSMFGRKFVVVLAVLAAIAFAVARKWDTAAELWSELGPARFALLGGFMIAMVVGLSGLWRFVQTGRGKFLLVPIAVAAAMAAVAFAMSSWVEQSFAAMGSGAPIKVGAAVLAAVVVSWVYGWNSSRS